MKFRRQAPTDITANLTPLIDVVFLLLIFFMVSTTFTKDTHLAINLPESSGAVLDKPVKRVDIVLNKAGEFAVNGKGLVNNRLETLKKAIAAVSQGDAGLPLVITADAKTPYQAVVTAMDAAGQLGFANLSMMTQQASNTDQ